MPENVSLWQRKFLQTHQLDDTYLELAEQWFKPLLNSLVAYWHEQTESILVAINGSQGSGKSTLADYLVAALINECQMTAVSLSLDDFYYTRAEREKLSRTIHPLLAMRGVPGTHDISLLNEILDALINANVSSNIRVPRFDKGIDERRPEPEWDVVNGAVDIVILEGWCMGATPQSKLQLVSPVNALERDEDSQGVWRSYVNTVLAEQFCPIYSRVGQWIMLEAPSFDCVYRWRLEQEHKLAAERLPDSESKIMSDDEVERFVQYYQRLTLQCLEKLPEEVDYLLQLDEERTIQSCLFSTEPRG